MRRIHLGMGLALAWALWGVPGVASAANIIVSPTTQAAPLIGPAALAILALLVMGMGSRLIVRSSGAMRVASVFLVLGLLSLVAYANGSVIVLEGDVCSERTRIEYENEESVRNDCANRMTIVSVDSDCGGNLQGDSVVVGPVVCAAGVILNPSDTCELPSCVPP